MAACAQALMLERYQVRVVTKDGVRFKGILNEVTDNDLYIDYPNQGSYYRSEQIPLADIRKLFIRRENKKNRLITGAIIGGLIAGFLANESLQKYQPRSSVTYGLNLTFAAAGGAAIGVVLSSVIGNVSRSRVIRPLDPTHPELSLQHQLEPYSLRYQQDIMNNLPRNPK